jgi:integrase
VTPRERKAARALAKKRARVLAMMAPGDVSVDLWLSSYLGLFPSERSEKAEREHLSMVRAFRTAHGDVKVRDVTPLLAQAWAMENPGQVRHLSRAWRKAVLMGVAPVNVWRLVEMPARTGERRRPPSETELAAIIAACEARVSSRLGEAWWLSFRDMILVAAYSGAREGGLIALRRSAVDLRAGRMMLTEKGGKTRTVVLCGPGRPAMERQLRVRLVCLPAPQRHLVFVSQRWKPLTGAVVQKAWREVRGDFPHGFHSLRHYAATWLRAQGVDERDVAIQLGHTDAEGRPLVQLQDRVYVHPDPEEALRRIERAVA